MSATHAMSYTPFLAFANDSKDIDALKQFSATHGWNETNIHQGDIKTATEFLKTHTSPELLLVEIPSASEAPALLDGLAEVCAADTKVIVIGSVNEYSFYCWLMEIGIFSYLLRPLTVQALDGAYQKMSERPAGAAKHEKQPAKMIAVIGARGGVGTSTVALNLAGVIAEHSKKNIGLIDLDPQEGTLALTLDIEPSRGLREALEKPDRIDSLFIERVMSRPHKHLSILSAEESLQEDMIIDAQASEHLLKEMRGKFDVLILDVPRYLNAFTKNCLAKADHVLLITELTLASLRDTMRLSDLMRETFKMKPPMIISNRKGMTKHEMKQTDFEKGLNGTISHAVPYAPDLFMPVSTEIPALKIKTHAATKVLSHIAIELVPEAKHIELGNEAKKLGGLLKKKTPELKAEKKEV